VPLIPHSDELGALARALAGTTRDLADWFGLAHSAPTSDVRFSAPGHRRHGSSRSVGCRAPHEAKHEPERPRAATPTPGLGARARTPGTPTALPDPTTCVAGAQRSSRLSSDRCAASLHSDDSAVRVFRTSSPSKLHRQHFTRSSYRCRTRLAGSCNSIFKDEHPSNAPITPAFGQSELRASRLSAHFGDRQLGPVRRFLPIRCLAATRL